MKPEAFSEVGLRLDVIIGLSIGGGFAVLALLFLAWWIFVAQLDDLSFAIPFGCITGGLAVLAFGATALPLLWMSTDHYKVYRVDGTITEVTNVFEDASGSLTSSPVVTLDTIDRPIQTNDRRFVNYIGRDVTLTCQINWRYQSADRYGCELYDFNDQEAP